MEPTEPRLFVDMGLRGARFVRSDLRGVVMRGVLVDDADIDAPWLLEEEGSTLLVNGVNVAPYVDAELDRRFPGRSLRRASDAATLARAWDGVEAAWALAVARAQALPGDAVNVQADGEWSFAQTLRHLVMATDTWLGRAVLRLEQPYHPLGQPHQEYAEDGYDTSIFTTDQPTFAEVLEVRNDRMRMVREYIAAATPEQLAEMHPAPWDPDYQVSTAGCLQVIIGEEWEHLRYALRDLDAVESSREP